MANGDLLRQLFRGYAKRDDSTFRNAANEIIREERAKNHRLLADDLERILMNGNGLPGEKRNVINPLEIPKDRERGFPLLDIAQFTFDWERIVLQPKSLNVIQQIAREHSRKDLLAAGGIKPRQRVLFFGPPGCGKTLAAQVLASVLSYPLVTVRFDAVVSSYLGETAANLRRVFDFIQRGQWVVLFDEFDAIGKDRDNPFEHGELKRVVNSLLQLMDAFRGESLLIAATNYEGLLDKAIWRRFEAIVHFTIPTTQDRVLLLRQFLRGFECSDVSMEKLAGQMKGATGSDIERFCIEAVRLALMEGRNKLCKEDIKAALDSFHDHFSIEQQFSRSENSSNTQTN